MLKRHILLSHCLNTLKMFFLIITVVIVTVIILLQATLRLSIFLSPEFWDSKRATPCLWIILLTYRTKFL